MAANYTPYKAKMRVYGQVASHEEEEEEEGGNLYATPVLTTAGHIYSAGFHHHQAPGTLTKKFSSDPVLSEDCTDDYAEPQLPGRHHPVNSTSYSDNIYARALVGGGGGGIQHQHPPPPLLPSQQHRHHHHHGHRRHGSAHFSTGGGGHYAQPITPPTSPEGHIYASAAAAEGHQFIQYTQSKRAAIRGSPPKTLNLPKAAYGGTGGRRRHRAHSASHLEAVNARSPAQSSVSSVDRCRDERVYGRPLELPVYSQVKKSPELGAAAAASGPVAAATSTATSTTTTAHVEVNHRRNLDNSGSDLDLNTVSRIIN